MIKLLNMRLVNIAKVVTGLQVSDVFIDFTELTNPLTLLVGVNGSGKTAILHCIHPFAFNTSIGDSSSNAEFIVDRQNGQKIIVYMVDNDIYTINHVYTRNSDNSISVKSFVSRGDTELNPRGTSGTFKDIIFDIFELDETYLGLLSLGNTVKGFVDYTGSNRKQTVTKIFNKLDVFNIYYKNATRKSRETKALLSNVTAKLNRLGDFNKEDAAHTVYQIEQKLDNLTGQSRDISATIGSLSQKISTNKEFIETYQLKKNDLMNAMSTIDKLRGKIQTKKDIPALENELTNICNGIEKRKIDKASYELNLKSALDYAQSLKEDLETTVKTVDDMKSDTDLMELDKAIADLEMRLSNITVDMSVRLDKDKLIRANVFLEELKGACIDFITNVDPNRHSIIAEVASKYLKGTKLLEASEERYANLVKKLQMSEYIKDTTKLIKASSFNITDTSCETKQCPYRKFYEMYKSSVSKKTGELGHELHHMQLEVDVAKDMIEIGKVVSRLKTYMSRNADILSVVPIEVFNPETFVDLYMDNREIIDVSLMASLIDTAEMQEEKESIISQLNELQTKRKNNESLRSTMNILQKRIADISEKLESANRSISAYQNELPNIDNDIQKLESIKKRIVDSIELSRELENTRRHIRELSSELSSMEGKTEEINELQTSIIAAKNNQKIIDDEISDLQKKKLDIQMTIKMVSDLENEQYTLMEEYSEIEDIRDATSPSKGIPLNYIKDYIKGDLAHMVNELLDMVYHGKLRIDAKNIIINEDEFTIPYKKNGIKVRDIAMASDGERAILSLAFSLSLTRITSKKYNLLLLDEMDTALDIYSRSKYIGLIEAYMSIIHAHQVFLISHNSMFDNYPVNVLLTSDMNISNMKTGKIIKLGGKCHD